MKVFGSISDLISIFSLLPNGNFEVFLGVLSRLADHTKNLDSKTLLLLLLLIDLSLGLELCFFLSKKFMSIFRYNLSFDFVFLFSTILPLFFFVKFPVKLKFVAMLEFFRFFSAHDNKRAGSVVYVRGVSCSDSPIFFEHRP